jgi:hypothetical protein
MTEREIIAILKESSLWNVLSEEEKDDAITYVLATTNPGPPVFDDDYEYVFRAINENYSYYLSAIEGLE